MPGLPARLTLPSGKVVALGLVRARKEPRRHRDGEPLFAEVLATLDEDVRVEHDGKVLDARELPLTDFHVLRAVLVRGGLLEEEEVAVRCRNCDEELRVLPCAALEIGPWVDGELGDEELDATLPFGEPHPIAPLPLGKVRVAKTVTLAPRRVREVLPLWRALARDPLDVDAAFSEAMGVVALGPEKVPARIAEALATCDDRAFTSVTDVFLASHYPVRLGAAAFCDACGARNDVDAPYERELVPGATPLRAGVDEEAPGGEGFPDLDAFAARARAIATPMLDEVEGQEVELVVEGGTPAVDDGGEPLLGSYVPPHAGDMTTPSRAPTVTVYHRTFRAMWDEEGPYDWEDELHETIEHELEHHDYWLRGDDPMDDEERAEIRDEGLRLVGRREANRRALGGFGESVTDFARRAWPLFVLLALAFGAMLWATSRD